MTGLSSSTDLAHPSPLQRGCAGAASLQLLGWGPDGGFLCKALTEGALSGEPTGQGTGAGRGRGGAEQAGPSLTQGSSRAQLAGSVLPQGTVAGIWNPTASRTGRITPVSFQTRLQHPLQQGSPGTWVGCQQHLPLCPPRLCFTPTTVILIGPGPFLRSLCFLRHMNSMCQNVKNNLALHKRRNVGGFIARRLIYKSVALGVG